MNNDEYKRILKEEGFKNIYEWTDKPNTKYEEHSHKGKVSFYIVKGDIEININKEFKKLNAGDRIDIPVSTPHTAITGLNGCTFIVGEEIEGDS